MSETTTLDTQAERLGIGHNQPTNLPSLIAEAPDLPADVLVFLGDNFARIPRELDALLERARAVPATIDDDESMGVAAKLVKEFRDLTKEIESHHASAKAPYFRSSQTVDNFFFSLWDKAVRRIRTNKPGAADILNARIDDYNQRKLRTEQERRRQEEERTRREAEAKRREEEETRRKAEEDRLAAERARNPEKIAEKTAAAAESQQAASAATVEADLATDKAQAARVDTFAKPADMVRTRVEEGPTVTMATEAYAVVTDHDALDLVKLRPFIPHDALEKALRAWAKTTNFNVQMPGAEIGRRPKTVVR
jgi:hypothetical protein